MGTRLSFDTNTPIFNEIMLALGDELPSLAAEFAEQPDGEADDSGAGDQD